MPTRKQRRRRQKTFRHDYGFVTYDEEGNEVEVDPAEVRSKKPEKAKSASSKQGKQSGRSTSRSLREPPKPSWRRAVRRGGLWGGVMILVVVFFFRNMPVASRVFLGLLYAAAFIPLTYWIDRLTYRNWERRAGKSQS
jgi:cytochrome c-type biogenesis protein CcmH/NrfG